MKTHADGKHHDVEFQPVDLVLFKLKPYYQRSLAKKLNEKLSPCFYGPFEVFQKIEVVAYRLKLPKTARIFNVFHVS